MKASPNRRDFKKGLLHHPHYISCRTGSEIVSRACCFHLCLPIPPSHGTLKRLFLLLYVSMQQLDLFCPHDEESLRHRLSKAIRMDVSLFLTDNSSTMLSARRVRGALSVRMHRLFLNAGTDVIEEAAAYIRGDTKRTPLVSAHIELHSFMIRKAVDRVIPRVTRGRHHDLQTVFNGLNRDYFRGSIAAAITWGRRSARRCVRCRTLGSYSHHANLIRINPVLDRRSTPLFFLQYVVYHEMLHADLAAAGDRCSRMVHSDEFRRRERLFRHYRQAVTWEKQRI